MDDRIYETGIYLLPESKSIWMIRESQQNEATSHQHLYHPEAVHLTMLSISAKNTTLIHKNPFTGLLHMKYLQDHLECPITDTSLEGYEAGFEAGNKHVHTNLKYSQERLGQISLKDVKSISIGIINI